jgi:hypothetical protein
VRLATKWETASCAYVHDANPYSQSIRHVSSQQHTVDVRERVPSRHHPRVCFSTIGAGLSAPQMTGVSENLTGCNNHSIMSELSEVLGKRNETKHLFTTSCTASGHLVLQYNIIMQRTQSKPKHLNLITKGDSHYSYGVRDGMPTVPMQTACGGKGKEYTTEIYTPPPINIYSV